LTLPREHAGERKRIKRDKAYFFREKMSAGALSLEIELVLLNLGWIIITATLFNFIARALKQPPLLAYILAGFFLFTGIPFITGMVLEEPIVLFQNMEIIHMFSELGIAFLLFSIGIETDLSKLKRLGSTFVIGGFIQVVFTAAFVFFSMQFFQALSFYESIYLALILSFSSTMLVVKLLSDSYSIDTMQGRLMIGFLLVQDVLIVILLPFLSELGAESFSADFFTGFLFRGVALIVLALGLSKFVYPLIFRFSMKNSEMLYLAALSSCFGFIIFSYFVLKIPLGIGGFVAGLSLSMLPYNYQIYDEIRGIRDFFVTIFLVTLGLQLSFGFFEVLWKMVLFSLGVVLILKPILFFLISYFSGHGKRVSLFVALGLAQVSEFSFILASLGFQQGLLNKDFYSASVFIIAFSMLFTPYIFKYQNGLYELFDRLSKLIPSKIRKKKFTSKVSWLEEGEIVTDHIVLIGTGVVGGSIARTLHGRYPLIAMDQDPDKIEKLKKEHINAFLGEADNKTIWNKLRLDKAKLLVLAIPKADLSLKLLNHAKEINSDIIVFARAHSFEDAARLYEAGADFVCMPEVVGSNVYLKTIMEYLDSNTLYHINVLHDEIIKYLKERSKEEKPSRRIKPTGWF